MVATANMTARKKPMRVKPSLASKRKRAPMRRDQPNSVRSSIKAVAARQPRVKGILVIDVGGTSVKILATGQTESRSFRSGPRLTPRQMVSKVKKLAADWTYDVISIGYSGSLGRHLLWQRNINAVPLGYSFYQTIHPENKNPQSNAALSTNFLRPYSPYGDINLYEFASNSNYHGLMASWQHRLSHGLNFSASYTFGTDSRGNSTSTTAPMIWTTLPWLIFVFLETQYLRGATRRCRAAFESDDTAIPESRCVAVSVPADHWQDSNTRRASIRVSTAHSLAP